MNLRKTQLAKRSGEHFLIKIISLLPQMDVINFLQKKLKRALAVAAMFE
ncbi:MAG TPA: hypothetical protein VL995_11170 [Cellvibrio sp.]|nr:hypothetical protein [Cellvibrio sp.]